MNTHEVVKRFFFTVNKKKHATKDRKIIIIRSQQYMFEHHTDLMWGAGWKKKREEKKIPSTNCSYQTGDIWRFKYSSICLSATHFVWIRSMCGQFQLSKHVDRDICFKWKCFACFFFAIFSWDEWPCFEATAVPSTHTSQTHMISMSNSWQTIYFKMFSLDVNQINHKHFFYIYNKMKNLNITHFFLILFYVECSYAKNRPLNFRSLTFDTIHRWFWYVYLKDREKKKSNEIKCFRIDFLGKRWNYENMKMTKNQKKNSWKSE